MGDLNFSSDALRLANDCIQNVHRSEHKQMEQMFFNTLVGLTEIEQDRPTFTRGKYLARLDYMFTKLPSAILLALQPVAHIKWEFGHQLGESSDHVPVFFALGASDGRKVVSIPRWVAHRPDYKQHRQDLIDKVRISPGNPLHLLSRYKYIMSTAASLTISNSSSATGSLSIYQHIYWALMMLRCACDPKHRYF